MFWETIIQRDSQVLEENYLIQLISLDLSLETHALTNSSITHEIYNSSDWGYEVRGVSLDISKALDKVWHDAMFKLEKKDISGNLRDVLPKQRVVLNGQVSPWAKLQQKLPKVRTIVLSFWH